MVHALSLGLLVMFRKVYDNMFLMVDFLVISIILGTNLLKISVDVVPVSRLLQSAIFTVNR
jgi:hypothetical protein